MNTWRQPKPPEEEAQMAELDVSLLVADGAGDPVAVNDPDKVDWHKNAEELQTKLDDATAAAKTAATEAERNIRRQSSSLQGQINTEKARADSVHADWRDRFHAEKMSGMEEVDALRYETSLLTEDLKTSQAETATIRTQAEQARSASGYIRHFGAMGIQEDRLNTSGTLQELADSGYAAEREDRIAEGAKMTDMAKQVETLTTSLAALNKGEPDPNVIATEQGDLTPPRVAVVGATQVTGTRTMVEALEAAKQYFGGTVPSEEMLYRAVETKALPASVLPGLEGMPREADVATS